MIPSGSEDDDFFVALSFGFAGLSLCACVFVTFDTGAVVGFGASTFVSAFGATAGTCANDTEQLDRLIARDGTRLRQVAFQAQLDVERRIAALHLECDRRLSASRRRSDRRDRPWRPRDRS